MTSIKVYLTELGLPNDPCNPQVLNLWHIRGTDSIQNVKRPERHVISVDIDSALPVRAVDSSVMSSTYIQKSWCLLLHLSLIL